MKKRQHKGHGKNKSKNANAEPDFFSKNANAEPDIIQFDNSLTILGRGSGCVVKTFACYARGPKFDPQQVSYLFFNKAFTDSP